jgi:CheY-like chemotaxis protein
MLSNAIKFTDRGEVCLQVELLDGSADEIRLRYAVVDTGRGIAADMRERVFERFVRVEEDLHSRTPGSGLGLSICNMLLQAMGSRMELQSQIGEGSCFSFEMVHALACDEALPSTAEWAPEHSSRGAEAIRVLVVDDDRDNLELLGRWVRGEGFSADLACNAREALSMVDSGEYALLLTDLHMPGVDGFEFARLLRQREAQTMKPRTPLVAVTADSLLQDESSRALEQSFDSVLIKPVQPRLLRRLLARCLPEGGAQSARAAAPRRTLVDASLIDLIPDYLARRREDLVVLKAFLCGHAPDESVMTIAHRMRGTGLSYGFPRIGKLGASLEEAARASRMDRIAELVEELERFVEQAERTVSATPEMKRTESHGL